MTKADAAGPAAVLRAAFGRVPRRLLLLAVAAVAVLALAVVAVVWWVGDDEPTEPGVAVVHEFFDALADKDVDAAMALIQGDSRPPEDGTDLLVPEAIGDDWDLVSAEVLWESDEQQQISAQFSTPVGDQRGEYEVWRQSDGSWLLGWVFTAVSPAHSPASYIQANDAVAVVESVFDYPRQYVFPGVYEFYTSVPDVVDVRETEPQALFWPQGAYDGVTVGPPSMTLQDQGLETVQSALDDRLDECLAYEGTDPGWCPFGLDGDTVEIDGADVDRPEDGTWGMDEEVEVTAVTYTSGDGSAEFVIETDASDKPVTLTMRHRGRTVTADCEFAPAALGVELRVVEGAVEVVVEPRGLSEEELSCDDAS